MEHVPPKDLADLKACSERLGTNRFLVQAAGGNTSVKDGEVMWIKASGTLLAHARDREIFVAVDLAALNADIAADAPEADAPQHYLFDKSLLRPSIETSLHAVFRQRVVLHVHCVNTIAVAIRQDARQVFEDRLAAFNWAQVPYAKPGAALARSVGQVLATETDVIVLGNHGLLVAADTVAAAERLVLAVNRALEVEVAPTLAVDAEALARVAGDAYRAVDSDDPLHQLALTADKVGLATAGSLYPDHVIFCGVGAHCLKPDEDADGYCARIGWQPAFLIVPGAGVIMRRDASHAAIELTRCLADVMRRVPPDAALNYLTEHENGELLNWDAETYRQRLNA